MSFEFAEIKTLDLTNQLILQSSVGTSGQILISGGATGPVHWGANSGSQGATGPSGVQGATGPMGNQGATGLTGATGPTSSSSISTMVATVYDSSLSLSSKGTIGMQFTVNTTTGVVTVATQGMTQAGTSFNLSSGYLSVLPGNVPSSCRPASGYAYCVGIGQLDTGVGLNLTIGFGAGGDILFENTATANGGWNTTSGLPSILNAVFQYTLNPVTPPP